MRFAAAIVGLGSLLLVTAGSAQTTPDPELIKAEVGTRATIEAYGKAWTAGDVNGLSGLFLRDADYVGLWNNMTRGRDDIQKLLTVWLSGALSGSELQLAVSSIRLLKPDVALVDGSLQLSHLRTASGEPGAPATGLYFVIMTKQSSGQWLISSFWSKNLVLKSVPPSP